MTLFNQSPDAEVYPEELAHLYSQFSQEFANPLTMGKTPLHVAAQFGRVTDLTALLNDPESNQNATDEQGNTPLHWATEGGHHACVSALLNNHAIAGVRNNKGLHLSIMRLN